MGTETMSDNETLVRDFIAAWSRLDVDEIVGFFAPDGVYHNMPMGPVAGREQLRGFIAAFLKDWTSTDWEILTLIGRGDTVVAERVDRTLVGDKPVDLPCCGVFHLEGGKIKLWRDYFDLGTYRNALSA
jgi:limonene-1,2-epoxide hydrolase